MTTDAPRERQSYFFTEPQYANELLLLDQKGGDLRSKIVHQ